MSGKKKINENKDQIINFKYDVQCNDYVKILIKDKKGSRTIYDLLAKTKDMTISNKWENELGNITKKWMEIVFEFKKHNRDVIKRFPI